MLIFTDAGYRGHNAPPDHRSRSSLADRSVTSHHKSNEQMRRRAAIERVIGQLKAEHRAPRDAYRSNGARRSFSHPTGIAFADNGRRENWPIRVRMALRASTMRRRTVPRAQTR
jgi:hypothetical protein